MSNTDRDNQRMKLDAGKPRIDLIPPVMVTELAKQFGVGAEKYSAHLWKEGGHYSRWYSSLQRHALAWWEGEEIDEETGQHHLVAVAWNALVLYWHTLFRKEFDDRSNP